MQAVQAVRLIGSQEDYAEALARPAIRLPQRCRRQHPEHVVPPETPKDIERPSSSSKSIEVQVSKKKTRQKAKSKRRLPDEGLVMVPRLPNDESGVLSSNPVPSLSQIDPIVECEDQPILPPKEGAKKLTDGPKLYPKHLKLLSTSRISPHWALLRRLPNDRQDQPPILTGLEALRDGFDESELQAPTYFRAALPRRKDKRSAAKPCLMLAKGRLPDVWSSMYGSLSPEVSTSGLHLRTTTELNHETPKPVERQTSEQKTTTSSLSIITAPPRMPSAEADVDDSASDLSCSEQSQDSFAEWHNSLASSSLSPHRSEDNSDAEWNPPEDLDRDEFMPV